MPLTTASTIRPRTSSTTAAARMMRLARSVQQAARRQHLRRDSDAGGHHRRAGEDALDARLAPERADSPSHEERHHDAGDRHQQRRAAHLHQLRRLHFQADAEEQEHHTEIGERGEEFAGRQPAKHVRPDQDTRENFSDDAGLSEAFEDFRQQLGRRETISIDERDLRHAPAASSPFDSAVDRLGMSPPTMVD